LIDEEPAVLTSQKGNVLDPKRPLCTQMSALGSLMEPPVRLLLAIAALLAAAPSAVAQAASDPAKACAEPAAASDSATAAAPPASDASKEATGAISVEADTCATIQEGQGATPPSSAAIAATLAEAERRVANLKFEVGPPPRNLTRGANSVSRPIS